MPRSEADAELKTDGLRRRLSLAPLIRHLDSGCNHPEITRSKRVQDAALSTTFFMAENSKAVDAGNFGFDS